MGNYSFIKKIHTEEQQKMDKKFIVEEVNRLDKFLSLNLNESRNQIETLIKKGFVQVDNKKVGHGTGTSKKEAHQNAARMALGKIEDL